MRYLAIDLGQKRTGLAIGDDFMRIATPVDVIETANAEHRLRLLEAAIARQEPDALVLGLPLNMDGTESAASKEVRAIGELLQQRTKLTVHYVDERLSSYAADQQMAGSNLTRGGKKARRDALAAANVLRDFLAGLQPGR